MTDVSGGSTAMRNPSWGSRNLPEFDSRHTGPAEDVAAQILASVNFRKMPYRHALAVTADHVRAIRAAALAGRVDE